MYINFTVTLLLPLLLSVSTSSTCEDGGDISPCTCSNTDDVVKVDCSGEGLKSVPDNLPRTTAILDFSNNILQLNSVKSICEYKHLKHVSIAGNRLSSTLPRSLKECDSIKSFNFSGNLFDDVTKYTLFGLEFTPKIYGIESRFFQEDALQDMIGLEELDIVLHQNNLPIQLFKDKSLKKLSIAINGASSIPDNFFDPLAHALTEFSFTSTSIYMIPEKLLSGFMNLITFRIYVYNVHNVPTALFQNEGLYETLESISLSGVKSLPRHVFWQLKGLLHLEIHGVEDIPSELFDGLLGLEHLDLSGSTVRTIPNRWFRDLWNIKELNLHDTGLTDIKREDFYNLSSLERLYLSKNNLRTLYTELFYEISTSVKIIDMSENTLKKLPPNLFKTRAVLECLDISFNQIYFIPIDAFYQLSELKRLYLQSNKLYNLEAATFIHNINIVYLDISSNILIDLPEKLFGSTNRLEILNLADNRIYSVERSIQFNLPTLREINLSFNPIECNCGTLAVKDLLSNVSIIGDCEKPRPGIAIVDFVPDTNCLRSSDVGLDRNNLMTTVVSINPSESSDNVWETYLKTDAVAPTLEPSFKTSYETPDKEGYIFKPIVSVETIYPTPAASVILSKEGSQKREDLVSIFPTSAVTFDTTGNNDSGNMRGSVHNLSEIAATSVNATFFPPKFELGFSNVTGETEMALEGEKAEYFYLSLISILSVALISVLIIVFFYFRRRRFSNFQVPRRSELDVYSLDRSFHEDDGVASNSAVTPLKEVPSIQIESVDDDGNVKVEMLSTTDS